MLNSRKNPRANVLVNPLLNNQINPRFNGEINPQHNTGVNPRFNGLINPQCNHRINPALNDQINPHINEVLNPEHNLYVDPLRNSRINPQFGGSFDGLCFFDLYNQFNSFSVRAENNTLIIFDLDCIAASLGVQFSGGYAVFDWKNLEQSHYLIADGQVGFNMFSLDGLWIGHAK